MLAPYASARAAALLLEHGGGSYVGMTAVEAAHEPTVVEMAVDLPSRVAGIEVDRATVVQRLEAVGASVADAVRSGWTLDARCSLISVPPCHSWMRPRLAICGATKLKP